MWQALSHSNCSPDTTNIPINPSPNQQHNIVLHSVIPPGNIITTQSHSTSLNTYPQRQNGTPHPHYNNIRSTPRTHQQPINTHCTSSRQHKSSIKIQSQLPFSHIPATSTETTYHQHSLYHHLFPKPQNTFEFTQSRSDISSTSIQITNNRYLLKLARKGGQPVNMTSPAIHQWQHHRRKIMHSNLIYPIQIPATSTPSTIRQQHRKSGNPQQIHNAISSTQYINNLHHHKILANLHKTNTIYHKKGKHKHTNIDTHVQAINNTTKTCQQHLRDLHIISWNVDGGLNPNYKHHDLIQTHLMNYPSTTIILSQESIGTKGGYRKMSQSALANIHNMNLVSADPYCITAIYLHKHCNNFVSIPIPETIYKSNNDTLQQIHASAIVLQTDKQIRSRHEIAILNQGHH